MKQISLNNLAKKVCRYWPLAVVLLIWELLAGMNVYNTALLPAPSKVISAWWQLLESGVLIEAAIGSLKRVLIGFSWALLGAIVVAMLIFRSKLLDQNLKLLVEFIRPISPIAWIPLAILWFSSGDRPAYFIVFIAAFFPIFLNILLGLDSVTERHMRVARAFRADWRLRLTDVIWPAAKPAALTGCRLGLGYAWMSLVAAEMIGVRTGVGYLIQINRVSLNMENVLAVMATIGLLGWMMNASLKKYQDVTMPWWTPRNTL